ncbi:DUF3903 domain-containing protein [Ectobacillus panaciterrae]|uniref:DUF3903 domain-containing protein n=1 Tax=Ectobacillus panaciterrae TaxID=363872 RepID=UPI000417F884|nr:DUF3903 domain-containing protein [Ectobacillus panaciterrae]
MLFQYSVEYAFWQGNRYVKETVIVSASSESYAIQKVMEELVRRFGSNASPNVQVLQHA